MTYDLAKQLKDAGFPQTKTDGTLKNGHYIAEGKEPCFDPSLSELIEACGIGHFEFERDWFNGKDPWRDLIWRDGLVPTAFGSTPEKAIAKLWLALQCE